MATRPKPDRDRLALALCRRLMRWGAALAPRERRREHLREWDAELVSWWQARSRRGEPRFLRALSRSLLAGYDAAHLRAADASRGRRRQGSRVRGARPSPPALLASWAHSTTSDVRHALRSLRARPQWTAVTLLTLALGIGSSTVISSVVRSVVWKPLPYTEPERLVDVWPELWWSQELVSRFRDESQSYTAVAGWAESGFRWSGPQTTELVPGPEVTADLLEVLGATPVLGRDLARSDESLERDRVLISHAFWQQELGGSTSVVGSTLRLEDRPAQVVGVLPPGLSLLQRDARVAVPLAMSPESAHWDSRYLHVVARLKPGVDRAQAEAELRTLAARWREGTDRAEDWGADAGVVPLRDSLIEDVRPTMTLLLGAILCSLLVATANVANLMLARSSERGREVSVRAVLGARPLRLARQVLTETTVVALLGGALGVGAAVWGLRGVVGLLPSDTPRVDEITLDGGMLILSLVLTVGIGWLVGLAPAWRAARAELRPAARGASASRSGGRLRAALVAVEVALAVLLLVGAGLLVKSFAEASTVELGFETENVLALTVLPEAGPLATEEDVESYFGRLASRLGALPGVRSVATAHAVPVQNDGWQMGVWAEGHPPAEGQDPLRARWRPVSPSFFATAGVELVAGRPFDAGDAAGAAGVAILSENLAAKLFPDRAAIGERVVYPWDHDQPMTVVGIARDARIAGPRSQPPPVVYRPHSQSQARLQALGIVWRSLLLSTGGDPGALVPTVERSLAAFDPGAVVFRLETMDQVVSEDLSGPRVTAILVGLFAFAAFALGAIGIYGVMERSVSERLRELAIRVALGATDRDVRSSVLGRGLRLSAIGAAAGLIGALVLSRTLESLLFAVSPRDPWIFGGVTLALMLVALLASWWPARRAARTEPARTLAAE